MRRLSAWLLALGLLGAGLPCLTSLAAATRTSPSRPAATVRLGGVEYVDAVAFGMRFGLKAELSAGARKLVLKSKWTTLEFEADTRECAVNGLRVFLGEAARDYKGGLYLSQIDAERFIGPMLLPGLNQSAVPPLRIIMLDPGHGGIDPGMQNKRLELNEKTLALDTAQRLKALLEAQGYKVFLTRTSDRHLSKNKREDLQMRAEMAQRAGADLFISIHFNSVASKADTVTGVETFTMTPRYQYSTGGTSDDRDDDEVKQANPGNRNDAWNSLLGYTFHRELLGSLGASDRGLKHARFAVLRLVSCPAVLVESGYLSNDTEAKKIGTPAYRQKIADAIASGVRVYANALEGERRRRAAEK